MPTSSDAPPPELLNNDPNGFAWGVWHDRTPKLVQQIRNAHPYGPDQRQALDDLLEEISAGLMTPLPPDVHDHELWTDWGADYFGKPWLDAPFLGSEAYFYRRLLKAVDYFTPGPWQGVDPFDHLKTAELRDPTLEVDLSTLNDLQQLHPEEAGQAKLLASLWGNRADLGFRIGKTAASAEPQTENLVADDSELVWDLLSPTAEVTVVVDNAGRELLADLVFIDHLLQHDLAAAITLHLKPCPYYVSDATTNDFVACLRRLAETPGTASEISRRLWNAVGDGDLRLYTHSFYSAPWSYHHLPTDLVAELKNSSLTIMKGDLNYRRLVGDRAWPPVSNFADLTSYFPGAVAAFRTLKSDVAVGITPAMLITLEQMAPSWRTDGSYGLIQART
ncbi:damage-control phosphatase ARMT1 family protein [Actinocorallia libanotica]|uniref:Damage-control phosphatase ARMT1 family protein n=1 Tax=Actinocorallia libanotica TaxID=46162 RepID=A0ABP4CKF7_9ACTN